MTPEDAIRDRIAAELAAGRPPLGDLVASAAAEGRRRKRRTRYAAGAVSAVAVLAVAGAVVRLTPTGTATTSQGTGTGPTTTHPAPTSAPSPAPPTKPTAPTSSPSSPPSTTTTTEAGTKLTTTPIVKQVNPGTLRLDKGIYVNFTKDSMSWWEYEGGLTTQYNGSNTWGSDFVSIGAGDRLQDGFYVGDADVAAATVTINGTQHAATVVKVNGTHGWCGLYYLEPPGQSRMSSIQIDVFDATGKDVASSYSGLMTGPPPSSSSPDKARTPPITNIPLGTPFPGVTPTPPPYTKH